MQSVSVLCAFDRTVSGRQEEKICIEGMCELHSQALPTPLATSHRRTRERSGLIELERVIYPLVHGYPRPLVAKQDGELRGEAKHQAVVRVKLWTPKRPQGGLYINSRELPIRWVYKSSTEVKGMSSSMYYTLARGRPPSLPET